MGIDDMNRDSSSNQDEDIDVMRDAQDPASLQQDMADSDIDRDSQ